MEDLSEIIHKLKAWFPADAHKERELKGGGNWYFVPWQLVRERLDEVCPNWQVSYSDPRYEGAYCVVICTITICGVSRQGIGNAEIELLSKSGKDMSRGTPIERAAADAFKTAAEQWGVARYLDEQSDPATKSSFLKYMMKHGNGKAATLHHQNEGTLPKRPASNPPSKPFGRSPASNTTRKQQSQKPEEPQISQTSLQTNPANLERLRGIARLLGLDPESGDNLIKASIQQLYEGRKTSELSPPELASVRDRILTNYARMNLPDSVQDTDILGALLTLDPASLDDSEMINRWMKELNRMLDKSLAIAQ